MILFPLIMVSVETVKVVGKRGLQVCGIVDRFLAPLPVCNCSRIEVTGGVA